MMTLKDILGCTVNPSVEFPKFIKGRLGMNTPFRIIELKHPDGKKELYISILPGECEVIKGSNRLKLKSSGITGIPFHVSTWVGYGKQVTHRLMNDEVKIKDVSKEFLAGYLKHGKCSYGEYGHNYVKVNSRTKKCSHCDKVSKRKIIMVKKEVWS